MIAETEGGGVRETVGTRKGIAGGVSVRISAACAAGSLLLREREKEFARVDEGRDVEGDEVLGRRPSLRCSCSDEVGRAGELARREVGKVLERGVGEMTLNVGLVEKGASVDTSRARK